MQDNIENPGQGRNFSYAHPPFLPSGSSWADILPGWIKSKLLGWAPAAPRTPPRRVTGLSSLPGSCFRETGLYVVLPQAMLFCLELPSLPGLLENSYSTIRTQFATAQGSKQS